MTDLRGILTDHYRRHGDLVPRQVWEEARPEESPLHHRFEWDDERAGDAYRDIQAAELIRSVRITYRKPGTEESMSTRAFIARREIGDGTRSGYMPTEEVVRDELSVELLRRNFEREAADLKRKYSDLDDYVAWIRQEATV